MDTLARLEGTIKQRLTASPNESYVAQLHAREGRRWTVSDQLMKKELIVQGMGWGHLPRYLIERELKKGKLLSLAGDHLRGGKLELVAARRRDAPQGPIATRLWQFIRDEARALVPRL